MKKIIIVFEYDYEDCDIVSVPDFVADNVEKYTQEFLTWLSSDNCSSEYYLSMSKEVICETDGLVKWLNENICSKNEQAVILEQHVRFVDNLPIVDFW